MHVDLLLLNITVNPKEKETWNREKKTLRQRNERFQQQNLD